MDKGRDQREKRHGLEEAGVGVGGDRARDVKVQNRSASPKSQEHSANTIKTFADGDDTHAMMMPIVTIRSMVQKEYHHEKRSWPSNNEAY
eukprot:664284-Rhodomonas_salina.2